MIDELVEHVGRKDPIETSLLRWMMPVQQLETVHLGIVVRGVELSEAEGGQVVVGGHNAPSPDRSGDRCQAQTTAELDCRPALAGLVVENTLGKHPG